MQNNLGFLILMVMQPFISFKCLKLTMCQLCGHVPLVSGACYVSRRCKDSDACVPQRTWPALFVIGMQKRKGAL